MNKSIQILLFIAISVFGISGYAEEVPIILEDHVELSTYSDSKSILLDWSIPDGIVVSKITVYRTEDYTSPFTSIAEIYENTNRYLDSSIIPGQRYFYLVELEGIDGIIYGSSSEHPAFNRLKIPDDIEGEIHNNEIVFNSWNEIYQQALQDIGESQIAQILPHFKALIQNDSLDLEALSKYGSIRELFEIELYTIMESIDSLVIDFETAIQESESTYRNYLLMTPAEWENELSHAKEYLSEQIDVIQDNIQQFQDHVTTLPPIRISALSRLNSDLVVVDLELITFRDNQIFLMYKDQGIEVIIPDTLSANRKIQVQIPEYWSSVDIVYNGQILDRRSIDFHDSGYKIDVFNNIIPNRFMEEQSNATDYFINELGYNSETNQLSIELYVPAGINPNYNITINDSILWTINELSSYEDVYIDSVFTLVNPDTNPTFWIHGYQAHEINEAVWNESIILSYDEQTHIARNPNGKMWKEAQWTSFGKSNEKEAYETQKLAVPEVFALYQNYPNPFNSGTTISFDLLQDATVTLHISDATGRVVESFIEQLPLNSGRYSYQWLGAHHASGVYFFTVYAEIDNFLPVSYSRKMIYLK
ncbi:MAG: T9SS type A sorting domain-containing protein [Candidatus Marinimicrobia bacterium]|nr:T9SS type A sorting domain-containing protein [Candidatus Neomarinimicrobiota bacterium]